MPLNTTHAECPECGHDGPQVAAGKLSLTDPDDAPVLECGSCLAEFPNPFYKAAAGGDDG